ncbi:MAG TPA: glycosyltransferase family 2 protein [Gemmatimonadaceae bacterium]|nr:glycosyltransferase family 2 protein [Gemmatimonadaceae bacterium]
MLYICIPAYDEAATVGLLLWRIRKVFQEFSREYEIAVYDDGSSDATAEVLKPYRDVLPLTVLGGQPHRGYGAAVDALCQWAAQRTRYARRDAAILLQGDFTDSPEYLPELVKRFEGGADIVVAEPPLPSLPTPLRRARWAARWALKPFAAVPGVSDPFTTLRLYRISVLRDTRKRLGDTPLVTATGWAANAELLLKTAPAARRIEVVEFAPRYDLRTRASRVRPLSEAIAVLRFGPVARGLAAGAARTAATRITRAPDTGPDAGPGTNGPESGPGGPGRGPSPSPDRGPDTAPAGERVRRGRGRGRGRSRPRPVPVEPAVAQTSEPEKR